ncbi:MHC class II transactivator isoform X1 [Lates japonicus]|uniref:MHC class II transactivator isoform X1 n=1 Tax=Lates japonicus TaxID=270547 RepID=A0AAD3R7Z4_LATJO|nr:MHC class II transactivator isoform X1 [Lates japonicus]
MPQFEEVLDGVRQALTWASPSEIQALLEGLVEERIISDAYSKSLSLHRLTEGISHAAVHGKPTWEPGSDQIHSRGSQWGHLSQVWDCGSRESAVTDHNQTRLESMLSVHENNSTRSSQRMDLLYEDRVIHGNRLIRELNWGPAMDDLNHRIMSTPMTCDDQHSLRLNDEITELLRSAELMLKPVSDNERVDEGISEDEKEWLEKVEEAARRIAVPLWQNWDRGRRMLLPLVPCMTTGCATDENKATDCEAQCPDVNMEVEAELALACKTLDLYTDSFKWMENTDTSFALDSGGDTEGFCFSGVSSAVVTALNTDHFDICGAARNSSPVQASVATDNTDTCLEGQVFNGPSLSEAGAKMQEVDQDQSDLTFTDLDLPDDISEFMNEDYLLGTADVLFDCDSLLNYEEFNNPSDIVVTTELPCPDSNEQRQDEPPSQKRRRVPRPQQCTDENTPSRPKRSRRAGKAQQTTTEAQDEPAVTQSIDTGPEPSLTETEGLSTPPTRILHLHPSIRFITIPDAQGYHMVQTLRFPPPVITPTYILVPAPSTPSKREMQPLSPEDGAVAPVQMSSSPPGSLSDTASKAMATPVSSPVSPCTEISPCKESPLPQSPTVLDIPHVVKDYIQEAKAHMSQTCQDMEEGLSLTSHYVDVQVSHREIRSGKKHKQMPGQGACHHGRYRSAKKLVGEESDL